jgi:hypothetical protein
MDTSFRSLVERTVRKTSAQVCLRLKSFEQGTICNFQAIHYLHLQFIPNVRSEMIQNVKILCLRECSFVVGNILTFAEVVIFKEMYNNISFKEFLMENVSRLYLKKLLAVNICELARYALKSLFIRSLYRRHTNDELQDKLNCQGLVNCKMDIDSSGLFLLINPDFVKELIIDQNLFLAPLNIIQFQNIEQLAVSWFAAVPSYHKLISLHIHRCDIIHLEIAVSYPCLKDLKIEYCTSLKTIVVNGTTIETFSLVEVILNRKHDYELTLVEILAHSLKRVLLEDFKR